MKKIFAVLLLAAVLLTGCQSEMAQADEDGNMLFYSKEEFDTQELEGFFVLNEDGTFSPLMKRASGYKGEIAQADKTLYTRYLWFHNNAGDLSKLIPTVTKNAKVVASFTESDRLPSLYTLERYENKGYTIGCHVEKGKDNTLYLSTKGALAGSAAAVSMSEVSDEASYIISQINGKDTLPIGNVDNNMQMLLGLEKDKYYEFQFYKGTKYKTLTTIADTIVLQSSDVITLTNPYTKTKDGYFTINLPDNLARGYYYLCGEGLFYYAG